MCRQSRRPSSATHGDLRSKERLGTHSARRTVSQRSAEAQPHTKDSQRRRGRRGAFGWNGEWKRRDSAHQSGEKPYSGHPLKECHEAFVPSTSHASTASAGSTPKPHLGIGAVPSLVSVTLAHFHTCDIIRCPNSSIMSWSVEPKHYEYFTSKATPW